MVLGAIGPLPMIFFIILFILLIWFVVRIVKNK